MTTSPRPSLWRRARNSLQTRGKKPGTVDSTRDGFVFTQGRLSTPIRWEDVTRIDAGMRDNISIDLFFVTLHTPAAAVTIDEFDDGFVHVEHTVFTRWPEVRDRWVALQCGPLHQPQHETLWQK